MSSTFKECFIQKNTDDIKAKLKDMHIDALTYSLTDNNCDSICVFEDGGEYKYLPFSYNEKDRDFMNVNAINCEHNDNLFMALASIREEDDYHQWFTNGAVWLYSEDTIFQKDGFHKASYYELLMHFNNY